MLCKATIESDQPDLSKKVLITDENGNFQSLSLRNPKKATVFVDREGKLLKLVKKAVDNEQEYDTDPFTKNETEIYKKLLYESKIGLYVVNKLKNSKLITAKEFYNFLEEVLTKEEAMAFMRSKAMRWLFVPKITHVKKLWFDEQATSFNRLPLSYLGLTKADIFTAFKTAGLIK